MFFCLWSNVAIDVVSFLPHSVTECFFWVWSRVSYTELCVLLFLCRIWHDMLIFWRKTSSRIVRSAPFWPVGEHLGSVVMFGGRRKPIVVSGHYLSNWIISVKLMFRLVLSSLSSWGFVIWAFLLKLNVFSSSGCWFFKIGIICWFLLS